MTKPKIANRNNLTPIGRLEKRFEEYKKCHQTAINNCNKIKESHNKSNDALKALLERKSKLSDSKIKKKRSATTTGATNRKKVKSNQDQLQTGNGFFETRTEATPNVTLNVHSSEIPDMDWDSFDILNNPNFSMSINEQELDGVLNSCYSQTTQPCDTKTTQIASDVCKTSPNTIHDGLFIQNTFKHDETLFPPLFPPPENHTQQSSYLTPQNYLPTAACNYLPSGNIVASTPSQVDQHNTLYSMNLPSVNMTNNLSYQYHNPLLPEPHGTSSAHYFYNYPDYSGVSSVNQHTVGDNFQLPAMSTGWYNAASTQSVKAANCKLPLQQQQQQFVNTPIPMANYRANYPQYAVAPHQDNSHIQYQQMFTEPNLVGTQSYEPKHTTIANYPMIPEQQYYYMDYTNNANRAGVTNNQSAAFNSNRHLIGQPESRYITHQTNGVLCRNAYQ